jgi:hypothetical protein
MQDMDIMDLHPSLTPEVEDFLPGNPGLTQRYSYPGLTQRYSYPGLNTDLQRYSYPGLTQRYSYPGLNTEI